MATGHRILPLPHNVDPNNLPMNSKVSVIAGVYSAMSLMAFTVLMLRVYTRHFLVRSFGADDWIIIVAWTFGFGTCIGTLYGIMNCNTGKHNWNVRQPRDFVCWNSIQIHIAWIHQVALCLTRTSIFAFYLRVFPAKSFRILCYCLIAANIVWAIISIVFDLNVCTPVAKFWNSSLPGHCRDKFPFYAVTAALNILFDVTCYLSPFPMLSKLQVSQKQKIGLYVTFGLGLVACLASAVRVPYLLLLRANSLDFMYALWGILVWSSVELNIGIIGASLPTLKALLKKITGESTSDGYAGYDQYKRTNESGAVRSKTGGKGLNNSFTDARNGTQLSSMTSKVVGYSGATTTNSNDSEEQIIPASERGIMARHEFVVSTEDRKEGATWPAHSRY